MEYLSSSDFPFDQIEGSYFLVFISESGCPLGVAGRGARLIDHRVSEKLSNESYIDNFFNTAIPFKNKNFTLIALPVKRVYGEEIREDLASFVESKVMKMRDHDGAMYSKVVYSKEYVSEIKFSENFKKKIEVVEFQLED